MNDNNEQMNNQGNTPENNNCTDNNGSGESNTNYTSNPNNYGAGQNNYGANQNSYNSNNQGGGYQPPRYDQKSNYSYQNPDNMYHYGRENQHNDDYQWNLNDYSAQNYEQNNTGNGKPPKKKNKGLKVFLSMIALVLGISVCGFAVYGVIALVNSDNISENSSEVSSEESSSLPNIVIENKPAQTSGNASSDGKLTWTQIAEQVNPSVVGIQIYKIAGLGISGEGSGIIMSADGYIITNAHVVSGAQGIKIILSNEDVYSGELVGIDEQTDIAVVKIEAENLPFASFGNSDETVVGEPVAAIGNPGGMEFAGSMTHGIVSAINRNIKMDSGYNMNYIQVDAAINPGNSGGALVNEYGQVIGINTLKIVSTGYEGLGFAIPINEAMVIAKDLIENGEVTGRALLGFEGIQLDAVTARNYGFPMGISVQAIQPGSDLVNRGIVPGDILTKLDGQEIADFGDVRNILNEHKPGDVISITVYRKNNISGKGKYIDTMVRLVDSKTLSNGQIEHNQQSNK